MDSPLVEKLPQKLASGKLFVPKTKLRNINFWRTKFQDIYLRKPKIRLRSRHDAKSVSIRLNPPEELPFRRNSHYFSTNAPNRGYQRAVYTLQLFQILQIDSMLSENVFNASIQTNFYVIWSITKLVQNLLLGHPFDILLSLH